jgi:hypothetical protein
MQSDMQWENFIYIVMCFATDDAVRIVNWFI